MTSFAGIAAMSLKAKVFFAGAVLATVFLVFGARGRSGDTTEFRIAELETGDLKVNVSATGTLQPEELVDVGAQIAGQIASLGVDKSGQTVDYGSEVEQGAILAKIDDSLYLADVAQAEAQSQRASADLLEAKSKLYMAERDWARAQKLGPSDALSQSAYDGYRAAHEGAKAAVAVAEAAINQAGAALTKAKQNLTYCTIKSPVSGVIIDRRVSIGQTVVASLNAPSLFLIAKDLKRMQIWASVNEADIGLIKPGQSVSFRVDAFPTEEFTGTVGKVRLNASMTQNVVTYIVEVDADNSSGKLLPYLTASVTFQIAEREGALLAPNAALRWAPAEEQRAGGENEERDSARGTVWIPDGDKARPIAVKIGGTDGVRTEVESPELSSGTEVIVGQEQIGAERQSSGTTNPFAPAPRRGRGRGRN